MSSNAWTKVVGLVIVLVTRAAFAQNEAVAESLFRDGKRLMAAKKYDEACPKFAESTRIAPSSGVELALGLCFEAQGKTASAWGAYAAVVSLARRDARPDREKYASAHMAALEPKLIRVTYEVPETVSTLDGLELRQDGVPLGIAAWTGTPVDPGRHEVLVQAPGRVSFATTFDVGQEPGVSSVAIPPLALLPAAPVAAPSGVVPWRTVGFAVGGVGAASLVTGTVLGSVALVTFHDARGACPSSPCSNADAVSENHTAGSLADASTVAFVVGGAAVGAAVLMFLLAPSHDAHASTGLLPVLAPSYAGLAGSF